LLWTQVHPLQLNHAVTEVAERDRADDVVLPLGDPKGDVARRRVVEVVVERGIELEAELRQRVRDQRAEAFRVPRLERDD
jgi:hypothetical protein